MSELRLELFDDGRALRLVGADGTAAGRRHLASGDIDAVVDRAGAEYASPAPNLPRLGRSLFDWIDGPAERWLGGCLAERHDHLTLRIDVAGRLRHLPWELLAAEHGLLCADVARPFSPVRQVHGRTAPWLRQNRPLRVLFMAASPIDVEPVLRYEDEEQRILTAAGHGGVELVVEESGSLAGLRERLREHDGGWYDVLHLTGHAFVHPQHGPALVMETDTGERHDVGAVELARAIEGRWPRIVFVSGCSTGASPRAGLDPSFAESLVESGARCVLGWAHPVGDDSATVLAASLYEQLGVGERLDIAVARARGALLDGGSPYWHLLRAYADASPLDALVTARGERGRARLRTRPAELDFLDPTDPSKTRVCPASRFIGRRRLLQRGLRMLRELDPTAREHCEGIVLHGMGGLGKSSLAARLCARMAGHRRLVWVGELDEREVMRVISERFGGASAQLMNEPGLALRHRLAGMLDAAPDPLLFVLDDFERSLERSAGGAPRLAEDGRAVMRPAPADALSAMLWAIRETESESRVIVTCRYRFIPPAGAARLGEIGLVGLAGADLEKKVGQLDGIGSRSTPEAQRARALELAGGNPRLMEWCDRALATPGLDADGMLLALEDAAEQFREDIIVRALIEQLPATCQELLGWLAVCRLPVDEAAVAAIASGGRVAEDIRRAVAAGLLEAGTEHEGDAESYLVPAVVAELVLPELSEADLVAISQAALDHLHERWRAGDGYDELRAQELYRLAYVAGDTKRLADLAASITTQWVNRARFREAVALCTLTLETVDDYRIRHNLARAQQVLGDTASAIENYEAAIAACAAGDDQQRAALLHNLADIVSQQGDPARALKLYEGSLTVKEQIGDALGKAATLHQMAGIIARQGDPARALVLYDQSLTIKEQVGYARGKAATLHQMAGIIARQGDAARALELYDQSLTIKDQIGDARGKGATLHQMAGIIARQGDAARALELYDQSLTITEQIGDALGKSATLHQMADVIAQEGDPARALELYDQSLTIAEQIGDALGKATTLHEMAGIIAQQGDPTRALELYDQSLAITEQIGDAQVKAATLANMATLAFRSGDRARAETLTRRAASALAAMGAWPDVVIVAGNLGSFSDEPVPYVAQALWLATAVATSLEDAVLPACVLADRLGAKHDLAPLLASYALGRLVRAGAGEDHALAGPVSAVMGACLAARAVPEDRFAAWFVEQGLDDPDRVVAVLRDGLVDLVPADAWLFDRTRLAAG